MRKRIFIVEDDPFISDELTLVIENLGYEVLGTSNDQEDAKKVIAKLSPDLVCLDIDLKSGGSGLDIAADLKIKGIPFLFITSFFDEVTLSEAKTHNPVGYIVKPFRDVDIKSNLALAFHKSSGKEEEPLKEDMFVRKDGEIVRIDPSEILYLKGEDNYSNIHFESGDRILTSTTLKKMAEKMEKYGFVRIHKSYLVRLSAISGFNGNTLYVNEKALPIGKAFKSTLLDKITIL